MNHGIMRAISGTSFVFIMILLHVLRHFAPNELGQALLNLSTAIGIVFLLILLCLMVTYSLCGPIRKNE